MAEKDYPIIRVNKLANQRADEIVAAFRAQGIETSKSQFVSDLILVTPIPQPKTKKRRTRKAAVVSMPAAQAL